MQADQHPIQEELEKYKDLLMKGVGCYSTEHPKKAKRDLAILSPGWGLKVCPKSKLQSPI